MDGVSVQNWRERHLGAAGLFDGPDSDWLEQSIAEFERYVLDPAYPCFYGSLALRNNAVYFAHVDGGCEDHLPSVLKYFLAQCRHHPLSNLAVFFSPDAPEITHDEARERFWRTLARLSENDPCPEQRKLVGFDDPIWEFVFAGVEMFVVGASPSYAKRRSRNLGRSRIILFQPREVFVADNGGPAINDQQRSVIRARILAWDGMPHHDSLGVYGAPGNREWTQYFLPDDNAPVRGTCPLGRH